MSAQAATVPTLACQEPSVSKQSVLGALLACASDDDLRAWAVALEPFLPGQASDDGWLRGAQAIASYIASPVSRVYSLSSAQRIPVEHDGSGLVARKSDLDRWIRSGGGKRP